MSATTKVNTSYFWQIIVPILCLIVLVTFFYTVFYIPDWFLESDNWPTTIENIAKFNP
jgi:uncharacterized membrane protein